MDIEENLVPVPDFPSCNKYDFEAKDHTDLLNHMKSAHVNRITDDDVNKLGGILNSFVLIIRKT